MNFFAHALLAAERDPDPRWVFGAMTPDFVSMSRARVCHIEDERAAAGVRFHHRTDDAFHGSEVFVRRCADGVRELRALGVGRAPAHAVAHVGLELLLDGVLLDDPDGRARYLDAIHGVDHASLGYAFHETEAAVRFERMHARLREVGIPEDYRSPAQVAMRLRQILAPRRRLALAEGDEARLVPWLEATRERLIAGLAGALIETVRAAVSP